MSVNLLELLSARFECTRQPRCPIENGAHIGITTRTYMCECGAPLVEVDPPGKDNL